MKPTSHGFPAPDEKINLLNSSCRLFEPNHRKTRVINMEDDSLVPLDPTSRDGARVYVLERFFENSERVAALVAKRVPAFEVVAVVAR